MKIKKYSFILLLLVISIKVIPIEQKHNVDSLIQLLPSLNDSIEKVDILNIIAFEFTRINYDKSLFYASEALSLAKKINYAWGYSSALGSISYTFYYRSDYCSVIEYSLKKLKYDDSLGYQLEMANTYNLIGNVYYYMKDYTKAHEYLNKSLIIYKEKDYEEGVGNIYTCIGNIFEANNEIQKAEHYYLIGLDIHQKVDDKVDIAITNNNLGNLYYKHYKDTTASHYFLNALAYLPEISDMSVHALVYNNYGDYFLWLRQLDSAIHYLNKGYEIAEKDILHFYIKDISKSFSSIYAQRKDYERAYQFQKLYNQLNDSLFDASISGKVAFMDYQYNQEKSENLRTIEFLKQQRKIKSRLWVFIVITILAGAFGLAFTFYHTSKIKQEELSIEKLNLESTRLQEQLDFRNKEIVIIMMNLFERNELIRQVVQKLQTLIPILNRINQPLVEDIIHDLKGKYHENILNEFEYRFQKVHIDFYKNLSEKFPGLTSNDLRLCAFLKMNMNSKDIASLTHQTLNSIEVARTRLRKKLSLHQTDIDLVAFISKF